MDNPISNTPAKSNIDVRIDEILKIADTLYNTRIPLEFKTFDRLMECSHLAAQIKISMQLDEILLQLKAININL